MPQRTHRQSGELKKSSTNQATGQKSGRRDTSKYGNFDAADLCRRLETYKAKQRTGRREASDVCTREKREQSRPLDRLTTLPPSMVQQDRRNICDDEKGPETKPTSDRTNSTTFRCAPIRRRSQRNVKKLPTLKARKRDVELPAVVQQSSTEGSRSAPYVPRTAALGFTKTTPSNDESDSRGILQRVSATIPVITGRRGLKLDTDKSERTKRMKGRDNKPSVSSDREAEKPGAKGCSMHIDKSGSTADRLSSETAIADGNTKERVRILRGPVYDIPQQKHWAESDELISEKGGIRERLSHWKAWSGRARHDDSDNRKSALGAPRRRPATLPIPQQI